MTVCEARAEIAIDAARREQVPDLERLIAASAYALSRGYYDERQIEAAVTHVFGVDSDLVGDGTYLVARMDGVLAGCGGWSRRRTLFGGDRFAARESGFLDPTSDAARIRAFFVAADHARQGVAARLLAACEDAARQARFTRTALMATLPGVPFYLAHGYVAAPPIEHVCGDTLVPFVPMAKALLQK